MMSFSNVTFNWTTFLTALASLLVVQLVLRTRRIPKGLRLPPGPPGKFIFGNLADLPTEQEWNTVAQWGKEYGGLTHLKVLGTHLIYVNSSKIARELFEKRSALYSDRFISPMVNDLMGGDWVMTFMPYGDKWRRHRRTFNQKFHQTSVNAYFDVQTKQTRAFLKKLHESPNDFMEHVRHLSGAIIMKVIYGIQVQAQNDPHIRDAEDAMAAFAQAGNPGAFLVDTFPILKHVPAWVPGAGFQKKAQAWRVPIIGMTVAPFEVVKKAMAAGTAEPSFLTSLLEDSASKHNTSPDEEDVFRNTAAVAYLGGADTTVSVTDSFFLAMVLYPEVQRKAQAEIDALIGNRLPDFDDREELPYVNALCKEVLRWHPVVPLGVAHKVTSDDVYGDYFIPAGSIIIGNSWGMLRDEDDFGPETDKFKPERFFEPGVPEPTFAFGFGRRVCPGRYMADNSVFIAAASILKVFDISHARDSEGNEIPVRDACTSGFLSYPEPFVCNITLRPGSEVLLSEIPDN